MTTSIAKQEETRLARPLKVLAPLIKQEIDAGEAAGLEHYQAAGEMLLEAKSQLKHGEFAPWYREQDFGWSKRTAERYMALAEVAKTTPASFFTESAEQRPSMSRLIGDTRESHQAPPPPYQKPVERMLRAVDGEALRKEAAGVREEQRLVRDLGLQLIKIGYRILADKLHPDKGGSTEAMTRLNRVKSILEGAL